MNAYETQSSEGISASVKGIANQAERSFVQYHNLDRTNSLPAGESVFVGIHPHTMRQVLYQGGVIVEGGLGPACTLTLPSEQTRDLEQVIWFDSNHPYISALQNFSQQDFERNRQGFLMVAEEVSHFVYKSSYYQKFKSEPPEWMTEMVGALDKYNLLQEMYVNKRGRVMNPNEEREAKALIFTAVQPQLRRLAPSEHVRGHALALKLTDKLTEVARTRGTQVAKNMFNGIYSSDERTALQLMESIGIS